MPGENVQISQGLFHGLEALVTRSIAARDRVESVIEWMGVVFARKLTLRTCCRLLSGHREFNTSPL